MNGRHLVLAGAASLCLCLSPVENANGQAIELSGFQDVIKHWNDKYGRDRQDELYAADQVHEIAENIVRFQVGDGGWAKSFNPVLIIAKSDLQRLLGRSLGISTFDNRCTYPHIAYLAQAYKQTHDERFRAAAQRGLDYVFREQRPTGGWRGADVDAVTYNDDVMIGVMQLLRDIELGEPHFDWLDAVRRAQASAALRRAIAVTLHCQIVVDGTKTAWCQQHSHETFSPIKARSYELPSICPAESTSVVRFLMQVEQPSPEVIEAIEAAVAWMDRVKLTGIRVKEVKIEPVRFENHTTSHDRIVVEDPAAPPIWTRYYEIDTGRPFFCNRDGTKVYTLAEVHHERRTGYGWYTGAPQRLLEVEYPLWKAGLESMPKSRGGE